MITLRQTACYFPVPFLLYLIKGYRLLDERIGNNNVMKTKPIRLTGIIALLSFVPLSLAFAAEAPPQLSTHRSAAVNELSWPATIRKPDGSIVRPFFELQRSTGLRQWKPFGERLRAPVNATDQVLSTTAPASEPLQLAGPQRLADGKIKLGVITGGQPLESIQIEAASKLSPPDWKVIPVAWDLSNPSTAYDSVAAGVSQRFYRAVSR
jgi:hypothetical protein